MLNKIIIALFIFLSGAHNLYAQDNSFFRSIILTPLTYCSTKIIENLNYYFLPSSPNGCSAEIKKKKTRRSNRKKANPVIEEILPLEMEDCLNEELNLDNLDNKTSEVSFEVEESEESEESKKSEEDQPTDSSPRLKIFFKGQDLSHIFNNHSTLGTGSEGKTKFIAVSKADIKTELIKLKDENPIKKTMAITNNNEVRISLFYNLPEIIGKDQNERNTRYLKVIILENGRIITAYPVAKEQTY